MPTRRTTLAVVGTLVAGGAGAVATGAFSAATAERDVNVEFADDSDAILGFEATSPYADEDEDGLLGVSFEELNRNTDFTFQDTFRIVNNGDESVRFDRVTSADENADWNYEDENSPARVLVADEVNGWQGTMDTDEEFVDDDDSQEVGRSDARDALDGSDGPVLEPGEWISIGFGFWGTDGVGEWDENDVPSDLQINFGG